MEDVNWILPSEDGVPNVDGLLGRIGKNMFEGAEMGGQESLEIMTPFSMVGALQAQPGPVNMSFPSIEPSLIPPQSTPLIKTHGNWGVRSLTLAPNPMSMDRIRPNQQQPKKPRGTGWENAVTVPSDAKLYDTTAMYHSELGTVCLKDIKGVYKNCRGIWAAQWTDEGGQRHTKYFNPKYYSSEESARVNAYKFKLDIQLSMERNKGTGNCAMQLYPIQQKGKHGKLRSNLVDLKMGNLIPKVTAEGTPGSDGWFMNKESLVLTYSVLISMMLGFCGCRDCARELVPQNVSVDAVARVLQLACDARIESEEREVSGKEGSMSKAESTTSTRPSTTATTGEWIGGETKEDDFFVDSATSFIKQEGFPL